MKGYIFEKIKDKISEYTRIRGEEPNAILLPINIYNIAKEEVCGCNTNRQSSEISKIFGLNIIVRTERFSRVECIKIEEWCLNQEIK